MQSNKITELPIGQGLNGLERFLAVKDGEIVTINVFDVFEYVQSNPVQPPTLTLAAVSRPALVLAEALNAFGDSTTNGTGAPTGFDWPSQFRALATGQTFPFDGGEGSKNGAAIEDIANGGIGGQTSVEVAARITGLSPTFADQLGRTMFFCAGLNDHNDDLAGFSRTWPAQVRTSYETAAAALTGGKRMFSLLAPADDFSVGGSMIGADHVFHQRDMGAAHAELAVPLARYLRFTRELQAPDGTADAAALSEGIIPFTYRGSDNATDFAANDFAIIQGAGNPADLNFDEGTIYWNTSTSAAWRKIGASGAGSWETVDRKHFSAYGYAQIARLAGDIAIAEEGNGPPFAPPQQMRCAADAANGAVIGQLDFVGAAANFSLRTYADEPVSDFAVSNTGEVTKATAAALTEGETALVLVAQNENGLLVSPLDIFVTRPSTQTAPELRPLAAPGVAVCGRLANGMADGKQISCAFYFSAELRATQQMVLVNRPGEAVSQPVSLQILSNGSARMTVRDANNVQQFITMSTAKYDAGVPVWMLCSFDFATNTSCGFMTEAPQTMPSIADGANMPLSDASPIFLSSSEARFLRGLSNPFTGDIGFIGLWDSYVDWTVAANRRALFDASGIPAARTPYAAIAGKVPKFELWGGKGDWLFGTPDGSNGPQTLSISHRARELMS